LQEIISSITVKVSEALVTLGDFIRPLGGCAFKYAIR